METGIEADNIPECECLYILSNFLNVLQRDVPESEIPKRSLSHKFLFHADTMTGQRPVSAFGVKQSACVFQPWVRNPCLTLNNGLKLLSFVIRG